MRATTKRGRIGSRHLIVLANTTAMRLKTVLAATSDLTVIETPRTAMTALINAVTVEVEAEAEALEAEAPDEATDEALEATDEAPDKALILFSATQFSLQ